VTTITKFRADGHAWVWRNATRARPTRLQLATSLAGGGKLVVYNQLGGQQQRQYNIIFTFNPPAGMALIPAGTFTMGDTLDGESDAIPRT